MKNKNNKILIVASGGVIRSIYSSEPKVQFEILDFDDEELKNKEEKDKLLEERANGLVAVY